MQSVGSLFAFSSTTEGVGTPLVITRCSILATCLCNCSASSAPRTAVSSLNIAAEAPETTLTKLLAEVEIWYSTSACLSPTACSTLV